MASEKLSQAFELEKDNPELNLYRAWAKIKSISPQNALQELKDVDQSFIDIPSEFRSLRRFGGKTT